MDFYGFYTGKIFDAYQYLGAHTEKTGVTFRTFAPSASRIAVIGEFNDWQESEMNKVQQMQLNLSLHIPPIFPRKKRYFLIRS